MDTCNDTGPGLVWLWRLVCTPDWNLADSSCAATSNWAGLESVAQPSNRMAILGQYTPTCTMTGLAPYQRSKTSWTGTAKNAQTLAPDSC